MNTETRSGSETIVGMPDGAGLSNQTGEVHFIREVTVKYRGPRRTGVFIGDTADAADFIRRLLPDNSREHFVTLYLEGGHKVAAYSVTATGTATSCPVHPREVFQGVVLVGAVAVVVGHNHPSGDPTPSQCDKDLTSRLKDAGAILGIKVLDHVVIGESSIYSFMDHGW